MGRALRVAGCIEQGMTLTPALSHPIGEGESFAGFLADVSLSLTVNRLGTCVRARAALKPPALQTLARGT
jgi:hypothetical protein